MVCEASHEGAEDPAWVKFAPVDLETGDASPATSVKLYHHFTWMILEWGFEICQLLLQPKRIPTRRRGLPSGADSVFSTPFFVPYLHSSWSTPLRSSQNSILSLEPHNDGALSGRQ